MQTFLSSQNIVELEKRYRANLINSITGFKNANLIGTIDEENRTNLAVFNSVFHLGANPALIGFIVRPDSVERHTLENIISTHHYTINHVNKIIYKKAHQTAARYPRDVSEFRATRLTEEYKNNFKAPYVAQSHIQIGVQFKQKIDIELNGTILVIGEITQLYFPSNCIFTDGFLDIEKAETIACTGLDSYHTTTRISRLSYAKPDTEPEELKLNYLE